MLTAKRIQNQIVVKRKNQGSKKNVQLMQFYSDFNFIGSEQKASENLES